MLEEFKFIKILKTLTTKELNGFRDFIECSFFNKNEKIVKFYDYILKFKPDFESRNLTKEKLFKYTFGKEKFDYAKLKHYFNYSVDLLEDYIVYNQTDRNQREKEFKLLTFYRERKLNNYFTNLATKFTEEHSNKRYKEPDDFKYENRLSNELEIFYYENEFKENKIVNAQYKDLFSMRDNFILELFYRLSTLLSQKRGFRFELEKNFPYLQSLMDYVENNSGAIDRSLILVYKAFMLDYKREEKSYYDLKEIAVKEYKDIPSEIRKHIFLSLVDVGYEIVISGNREFYKELFNYYNFFVEKYEEIFEDDYLDHNRYFYITTPALHLNHFEWAKNFIDTFKDKLPPVQEDYMYLYTLANYYFSTKEFGLALEVLAKIKDNKNQHALIANKLKMQILYELKDFETLLYIIDSYRHFLKNYCKIFIETNPKINLNFVKYLKRLVDIQSGKKLKPDEVRFEIQNEKIITSRNWLLEKVNELI
ncbi:MAG: hypothetical protein K1X86_03900 [Ignavibacteria bacterium]|nr:hypothetical protein [Ignavibacteria bacterium]